MKPQAYLVYAVVGDLVGSRTHPVRRDAQRALLSALAAVNRQVPSRQELQPTIGDEFQGAYLHLHLALRATAAVRLTLPESMDARFGIGWGEVEVFGESAYGLTQDGPAWWAAREAIVDAKHREMNRPQVRTSIVWSGRPGDPDPVERERRRLARAYLECCDFMISGFDARQRRLTLGLLAGDTMTQIAERESISVSAVSQRIRSTGVRAVVDSLQALAPDGPGIEP